MVGGAGRDDPFGGLAGEGGDHVEVAVVVEDGQPVQLRGGGDEQVGERQGMVEARVERAALDLQGAGEGVVVAAQVVKSVEPGADTRRLRAVPGRVDQLVLGSASRRPARPGGKDQMVAVTRRSRAYAPTSGRSAAETAETAESAKPFPADSGRSSRTSSESTIVALARGPCSAQTGPS